MPMEGSDVRPPIETVIARPETPLESGAEYSFVVTPVSGDMAGHNVGITQTLSNEKGAPLSGSVPVEDGTFRIHVFSFNGTEEDGGEQYPIKTASVNIFVGNVK